MKKISTFLFVIGVCSCFKICFPQMEEDKENNYNFSLNYLYPQRYMQRVLWLARATFDDLQDVSTFSNYIDIVAKNVYIHAGIMKKAVKDLLMHQEEAENYLQEDMQEIIQALREIDRIVIALMFLYRSQGYEQLFQKSHDALCMMYHDAQKLLLLNKEVN